jgi:hypothetical protein
MTWLVQSLLQLIDEDASIDNDAKFYINADGTAETKGNLIKRSMLYFDPFLLGVFHYVIINHSDNKKGRDTYNYLYTQNKDTHKPRVLKNSYFDNSKYDISVKKLELTPIDAAPTLSDTICSDNAADSDNTADSDNAADSDTFNPPRTPDTQDIHKVETKSLKMLERMLFTHLDSYTANKIFKSLSNKNKGQSK